MPDRREAVGHGPDPHPLDVARVVPRPAGIVVRPLCDAIVDEK